MSSMIITDKTVENAVNKAVKQLGVSNKDELNIVVLENGSKGFFGFGSKDAKIEASVKEKEIEIDLTFNIKLDDDKNENINTKENQNNDHQKVNENIETYEHDNENTDSTFNPQQLAKDFLQKTLNAMDIKAEYDIKKIDKNIEITIKSDKDNVLIGKRGKTLESLEFLTNLAVNKGESKYVNIYIDVAEYKNKRKETLEQLANNLSKKVYKTKRRHRLEPMSRFERKIIHNTLQDSKYVKTYSEGVDPNRYIVIDIKQK